MEEIGLEILKTSPLAGVLGLVSFGLFKKIDRQEKDYREERTTIIKSYRDERKEARERETNRAIKD